MCVSTVETDRWQVRLRNMHLQARLNKAIVEQHEAARHTFPHLHVYRAFPLSVAP